MLNFNIFTIIFIFNLLNECLCFEDEDEEYPLSLYSDKVQQYDLESFKVNVGGSVPNFIVFFDPWCGHSIDLEPVWDELAEKYNIGSPNQTLVIGKVDCTSEGFLCQEEGIYRYPMLFFYNAGEKKGIRYKGNRDLQHLENFIEENLNKSVDCTSEGVLCQEEESSGYPSLLFNNTGEKEGINYTDNRDLANVIEENLNKSVDYTSEGLLFQEEKISGYPLRGTMEFLRGGVMGIMTLPGYPAEEASLP